MLIIKLVSLLQSCIMMKIISTPLMALEIKIYVTIRIKTLFNFDCTIVCIQGEKVMFFDMFAWLGSRKEFRSWLLS